MSRSNRTQRGYTIAELLTVVFILGLITSAVALFIGPLLRSQSQVQAKADTIQASVSALYRVERDIRNTTVGSIWACTTGASPACSLPPATLAATTAIVMPTAYQGGTGQFQLQAVNAKPLWQGATVYWIDSAGDLEVAFDRPSTYAGPGNTLTRIDAQTAVGDVTSSGGVHLARSIAQISLAVPPSAGHKVSFLMQVQSAVGSATNETTYQTDLETRN